MLRGVNGDLSDVRRLPSSSLIPLDTEGNEHRERVPQRDRLKHYLFSLVGSSSDCSTKIIWAASSMLPLILVLNFSEKLILVSEVIGSLLQSSVTANDTPRILSSSFAASIIRRISFSS